jgi:serine/threonine-protein kinase SRPK3
LIISIGSAILSTQVSLLRYLDSDPLNRRYLDIKPQNTLVSIGKQCPAIQKHLLNNPSATYEPRLEPDLSPDPIITVKSQPLPNFNLDTTLANLDVKIIDYGSGENCNNAHSVPLLIYPKAIPVQGQLFEGEIQPVLLRAPEVILGHLWSTPVDIWCVGCMVGHRGASGSLADSKSASVAGI